MGARPNFCRFRGGKHKWQPLSFMLSEDFRHEQAVGVRGHWQIERSRDVADLHPLGHAAHASISCIPAFSRVYRAMTLS